MIAWKDRLFKYYEENETKVDVGFFLGGVVFDIFTLANIDDLFSVLQQTIYLLVIGFLLFYDFLGRQNLWKPSPRIEKFWAYRDLAIHFLLGSLLSLYSLFFLKSASVFASFAFLLTMVGLMIANEVKSVQRNEIDLKIPLYFICVFSFFSMMYPVALGFVGWLPFILAFLTTALVLWGISKLVLKRMQNAAVMRKSLLFPGAAVLGGFFVFYLLGWIPPVPLSVQEIGIFHNIQKSEGKYYLSQEKSWWRFWRSGDQDFEARPGDLIHVFVRVFSPARFSDSVILHWQFDDPREGWKTTDRIPMAISGGRESGFRGFASKKNYQDGDWRVLVETTDGREIGRLKFWVHTNPTEVSERAFEVLVRD